MDHYRLVRLVVFADVLQLKAFWQIEIKLDRGQLPGPADRVFDPDIYLWTIEDCFALDPLVRNIFIVERINQSGLSAIPFFVGTEIVCFWIVASNRQLHFDILKTKDFKKIKGKVDTTQYLRSHGFWSTEKVRVILSKSTSPGQSVKSARKF